MYTNGTVVMYTNGTVVMYTNGTIVMYTNGTVVMPLYTLLSYPHSSEQKVSTSCL